MSEKSKLDYFIERTDKDFSELKKAIGAVHEKVDAINQVRWKIEGMKLLANTLFSVAGAALYLWMKLR